MRKKKVNIGDVFTIPLNENRYGYGQVVEIGEMYDILIAFDYISRDKILDVQEILSKDIVFLLRTTIVYIEDGYWDVIGNADLPTDLNVPKYYIRDGLNDFEVVTASEHFVRIATEEDLNKYSENIAYSAGFLEDALNATLDTQNWKTLFKEMIYKPIKDDYHQNFASLPNRKVNMFIEFSKGRLEINNKLSEEEVYELLAYKDLEIIQFSKPVDHYTLELLNNILFSERDDVELRIYGAYNRDLSFLSILDNVSRLTLDCIVGEVTNLDTITQLNKLKELHIGIFNLDSFEILNHVPDSLESITLGQTQSKKPDLSVLERFSNLKQIYIEGHIKNIDVIGSLNQLEDVTLRSITIKNIEFLTSLKKLSSLDIKLGGIKDFSAIEGMGNIQYLELCLIRGLKDLSFISSLSGLQSLFLQSLKNVEVLPAFKGLSKLKKIHFEDMKGLKDISSLGEAPALAEFTHWSAMNMDIEDYIPLLKNQSVERVSVGFGSAKRNRAFETILKSYGKKE